MGLAESSLSRIYAGKTTTEGTEPTTYQTIKPVSHSLSPSAGSFSGEFIDPNRKPADTFRTNTAGQGDIASHWLPDDFDGLLETALAGTWSAPASPTLTVSFGTPDAGGIQAITDDGVNGFAPFAIGDAVLIGGAVANPANAGLRVIVSKPTDDIIGVYNPSGVLSAADAGVDFDHNGTLTIGSTKSWQWVERVFNDGTIDTYSEWYKDCLVGSWNMSWQASAPSRVSFNLQGDPPELEHNNGGAGITEQRGGSDVGSTSQRLVHGMEDVRQLFIYHTTGALPYNFHQLASTFDWTLNNNIGQESAIGTASIIHTALGQATLTGNLNAFVNSATRQTTNLVQFLLDNPDTLDLFMVFGATSATAYGVWMDKFRVTNSPTPIGGNNQRPTVNAQFSASDLKITRI